MQFATEDFKGQIVLLLAGLKKKMLLLLLFEEVVFKRRILHKERCPGLQCFCFLNYS